MKSRTHFKLMMALAAMVWCGLIAPVLAAQDSPPASASQTAPVQLSVGVWDVLRLAQAKVSDGIITAYIKNSGKVYSLGASEILYLREQGLSDQVVTVMLDQRKDVAATTAQAAPQPTATAQHSVWANSSSPVPAATQPAPTSVQTAPVYAQPSPVYVYPANYGYYSSGPYYRSYWDWGFPAISFGLGYWAGHYGGHHGGGYHGGYHGGGHHGGGYHGGGHSGGHR